MKIKLMPRVAIAILLQCIACLCSAQINSLCDAASPCTANANVIAGVDSIVPILWRGTASVERGEILSSESGRLGTASRQHLANINVSIQQRLNANPSGMPTPFSVSESLRVPASLSQRALELGATQIIYQRAFTFFGAARSGRVTINITRNSPNSSRSIPLGTEAQATALNITRLNLRFNTGTQAEVLQAGQDLYAIATLNFERAGMLVGVWEIARPSATAGDTAFTPLKNIRQYLGANRQTSLRSPKLPTELNGIYRIRLRITTPTLAAAVPELRYQVNKASQEKATPSASKIGLSAPKPGSNIGPDSVFSWQQHTGAIAYQIEFYAIDNSDTPLTGMQVKGNTTSSLMSPSVIHHLHSKQVYYWRVVAIDRGGNKVGVSSLQDVRIK